MTYRAAANIDPNQHKGLIASNAINSHALVLTGLSLTNAQPLHVAVVDASGSQITSFSSTPITNYALETGGNLATIAGKDFATQTTLALIKAKTDNLDTTLSSRTKPSDQQHTIIDSGTVSATQSGSYNVGTALNGVNANQTTSNTSAVQLTASSIPATNGILVGALSTNAAAVFVAGSGVTTGTGVEILAGASQPFTTTNINLLYVIGANNTDKVWWNVL